MNSIPADSSTIAAIATPVGSGGIGIIKISGQNALPIAGHIFHRSRSSSDKNKDKSSDSFDSIKSHRLYHGHIINPENGKILDEVLLSVMMAPKTYTREDVVEIHAHSGPVALNSIMELVIKQGARLAEPGEFTKRAFLNGRIDLTQAEAVIDIINAKTAKSLEIAISQIKGDIKSRVESIRDTLIQIITETEAVIDFPDSAGESIDTDKTLKILQDNVIDTLQNLLNQYENAHILRDGLKLVVAGKPNVGKSSLMNRLIKKDRAIVTPIPGTTRDFIEDYLSIRGIPVIITDTAGLHETDDPVEVIGIKKAHEHIDSCDLVLFMVDASSPLTSEDDKIYNEINDKNLILVVNKIDLVDDGFKLDTPNSWNKISSAYISALYNRGIETLKDLIKKIALGEEGLDNENTIVPNFRHKLALEKSLEFASSVTQGLKTGIPYELVAIDLKEAIDSLGEILGVTSKVNVLDQIFSKFCIGK